MCTVSLVQIKPLYADCVVCFSFDVVIGKEGGYVVGVVVGMELLVLLLVLDLFGVNKFDYWKLFQRLVYKVSLATGLSLAT